MGPNGSGKSTLSNVIMGHPKYKITKGKIFFKGEDITELSPDQRAKKGIFLAFQYPLSIPGVRIFNFLKNMLSSIRGEEIPVSEFKKLLKEKMKLLDIKQSFIKRYLNDGFSGGEKKRNEILQMALFEPKLALLDETDSGLDVTALKTVCEGINKIINNDMSVIIITHYKRMLEYVRPQFVHVIMDGKIVKSGNEELVEKIDSQGYDWLKVSSEEILTTV
ncbi:MAG: ABC transporter ATP-binding protein [Candidatus Sericytochromatia bacterium]|nr:MAG: ABC transporter ATP-binding protein [Candidatus Sericytochromatia bacterium]